MRKSPRDYSPSSGAEKNSAKLIMERMKLSKKEFEEISKIYGVPPSKLLEVMQLSRYAFIDSFQEAPICQPCVFPLYKGERSGIN